MITPQEAQKMLDMLESGYMFTDARVAECWSVGDEGSREF